MLDKHMQILDIVYKYPCTQEVFHRYDALVVECIMCEYLFSTLEELAKVCHLDVQELIQELEQAIDNATCVDKVI
ncbi:MAG: hypothetical protein PHT79_09055 [Syntrophomonadaceae bacterium]|nr:hypothetical protein [Syntrophomonadaceae bacterium]MDD4549888.1 hypothetical protein [Syntrophomonadaceae bacterium]